MRNAATSNTVKARMMGCKFFFLPYVGAYSLKDSFLARREGPRGGRKRESCLAVFAHVAVLGPPLRLACLLNFCLLAHSELVSNA